MLFLAKCYNIAQYFADAAVKRVRKELRQLINEATAQKKSTCN